MVSRFGSALLLLCLAIRIQAQFSSSPNGPSSSENGGEEGSGTPAPVSCPAGGPIGAINLQVVSPGNSKESLPFRNIIHLSEGDTILYSPMMRGQEKRNGEISLVMVPEKRDPNADSLLVTDPKPADKPQEWKVPRTIAIAAYVYGPEGLSKRKVRGFLSRDDLLISQLADYAEKTSQTEALIEALSNNNSSSASVNAALSGFASQYGVSVPLDKTSPPAVQAQALFSTINPQLATYDPLTSSTSARISQTASLTTAAASLFFGSPVGLAAGGTAMLLDLHALAFPGTQFRSSFAQPLPNGLNLCGQRTPAPAHTRVAYIWANRIPNVNEPAIQIKSANNIPLEQKTPVPVSLQEKDWKYLDRARNWALETDSGQKANIKVLKLANQKSLEIDLTKTKLSPGEYTLGAYWDWRHFQSAGKIWVRPLSDFASARLEPSSQDRLLAKSGKVVVTLQNSDFEFTTKVQIKRIGDEFATADSVPFLLPKGLREGPQQHADVQINTADLEPGDYQLLFSQDDGNGRPVQVKVLPNPPNVENLPILANQGITVQHYVLKGERLGLLTQLTSPGAKLQLGDPGKDGDERPLTVQLSGDPQPGQTFAVAAQLKDRSEPLTYPDALRITGPLPVIASSKLSTLSGLQISVNPGEWPAGETMSAMLDVKNLQPQSVVRLTCSDQVAVQPPLHIGVQTEQSSLQRLSPDQLFLSFDTRAVPAGCVVQAQIDNGTDGVSAPFTLASLVRLPKIDRFTPSPDPSSDPKAERSFVLDGRNLEMIDKIGWDQLNGVTVGELPTPVPGQGQVQTLKITLPDPPTTEASIYVWLRGEKTGRSTNVRLSSKENHTAVTSSNPQ